MANKFNLPLCSEFEAWLREQGYDEATISNRISNVAKINAAYGDLLAHWKKDGLESVLADLSYSKKDKEAALKNPSKIEIDGDIYSGLATYRSALRLYIAFLNATQPLTNGHLNPIVPIINKAVDQIKAAVKNVDFSEKGAVNKTIIEPLTELLGSMLSAYGYTFECEHTVTGVVNPAGGSSANVRDRYDIIGESDTHPLIIIEVDTHRSDQVAKKMVSRIALNSEREMIYVSILYPNDHKYKAAEKQECKKYIGYISTLFTIFGQPKKQYLNYLLY